MNRTVFTGLIASVTRFQDVPLVNHVNVEVGSITFTCIVRGTTDHLEEGDFIFVSGESTPKAFVIEAKEIIKIN
jgi:hypothetical protein